VGSSFAMKLAREIYREVINLPPEEQVKVLDFVKGLNKELENRKIDPDFCR
jgi:hypothetical protein